MKRYLDQAGFTLVELLLAMSLFVTVMVISTSGFIAMNRTFTRGTVRKQLSEAVQLTTEDVTRAVRQMPQTSNQLLFCPSSDLGITRGAACPSVAADASWNLVCLTGSRYFWKYSADNGGLWRDSQDCGDSIDLRAGSQLMDERYKVVGFEIGSVGSADDHLFRIKGTFRTADNNAFDAPDSADTVKCRGSVRSSAVRTCAVERFDFIINTRGQI